MDLGLLWSLKNKNYSNHENNTKKHNTTTTTPVYGLGLWALGFRAPPSPPSYPPSDSAPPPPPALHLHLPPTPALPTPAQP